MTNIDPLLHSACEDRILKMNCFANQGKAKNDIARVNQAQKDYYSSNAKFIYSLQRFGDEPQSKAYNYSIRVTAKAALSLASPKPSYLDHKGYIGAVFADSKGNLHSIECKSNYPGNGQKLVYPTYQNGGLVCGKGTQKLN